MAQALSSHDVFSFLRPQQIKKVSEVSEAISIKAGDYVFRQGEPSDFLFAVLEGKVRLQLPRGDEADLKIEDLSKGILFGSCMCFDRKSYALTAVALEDAKVLKIDAAGFKKVMDDDLSVGYPVQRMISRTYFGRYLETMKKLQIMGESVL